MRNVKYSHEQVPIDFNVRLLSLILRSLTIEKRTKKMLVASLSKLDTWLDQNGFAGYDPYDIRGTKIYLFLQRSRCTSLGMSSLVDRYPMLFRRLFRTKKQVNPKAMALFARAYLNLYRKTREEYNLEKALVCLNWLKENPSLGHSGYCWGYPSDWQSRVFIPKRTPSCIVTSTAAHAFLDAYELLKDKSYLSVVKGCCDFIISDLNIDNVSKDEVCFSYTPIDHFHVHNANLLSASVLLRSYPQLNEDQYKELGVKAVNFSVRHQNEDGSWYYWAPPDRLLYSIDNYHTGFILESLNISRRVLRREFQHVSELRKGMKFYADNLFLDNGRPKMLHDSVYPIDVHSCAQGIITFCELADFEPKFLNQAHKVAEWTINNMQDKEGHFYYRIYKHGNIDKTPYIRWGQAWMLRALSYLV